MFVKSLKEHDEALKVIELLRQEVVGVVNDRGGNVKFAEIKDISSKLSTYAHLFNENALREFA